MPDDSARKDSQTAMSPLPSLSLPAGGGAIRDIGEKFSVNAATGTGTMSVPIPVSQGRGISPSLTLTYDSGSGNGPFGFGWRLDVPSITRKTDKGLPRYLDATESDTFILSGAEDLVPELDATGQNRVRAARTLHGVAYEIAWYRPRIESQFSRIERWLNVATGASHWRTITRDNITTLYGLDANSCIADPADASKIFSYLAALTFDDKGNLTVYDYIAEDSRGVGTTAAHEANRTGPTRAAQRYLKSIRYANTTPYTPDWSAGGSDPALPSDWYFQIIFDYGDHSVATPTPTPDQPWPVRPDPFSRYRSAFEVRTYRRCSRILIFHNFPAEANVGANCLARSLDLTYSDQQTPSDPSNPIYTFLASITQNGYKPEATGYLQSALPPLEFEYSVPQIQPDVLTIQASAPANMPEGIEGPDYRWIDLDGEGLSGILSDVGGAWTYKRNTSALNLTVQPDGTYIARARFDPLEMLPTLPSRTTLDANQRLMDLSADGRMDVVALAEPDAGYFERTEDWTWAPLHRFAALPQLDWSDRNITFVDLTGDGLADVLLTEDGLLTLWPSRGANGFDGPIQVRTPWDEERGPKVVLADGTETIFLADMSGDGLPDLVRVRNGEVVYWPHLGYGRFGTKVTMDFSPRFSDEERYDPQRVHLADIDGSGTADLVYVGDQGVTVCFNQSGNAWAKPQTIAVFPSQDPESKVDVVDLLGSGTSCLVWSCPLPFENSAPLRYVDLMGGQKPHLLTTIRNNLGAETRITYAPSTRFYLADRLAGEPWITRVHFPVQVVERVETFDWIGRSRFVSRYAYHHGYFDGFEREFRGFGRVEQWDTEEHRDDTAFPEGESTNWDSEAWAPPMMTRTWFHTGAFIEAGIVSKQYQSEYWPEAMQLADSVLPVALSAHDEREAYRALKGQVLRVEIYGEDGSVNAANPYSVTENNYTVALLQPSGPNCHASFYTHVRETLTFEYERAASDPRVTHEVTLEFDAFGNELRHMSVGYPRRPGYAAPEPTLSSAFQSMLAYDQTRLHITGTQNTFTNDLANPATSPDAHRTPMASETVKAEITATPPATPANPFAFADLDALWTSVWGGAHDIPFENIPASDVDGQGALTVPSRRIVADSRTVYRSDDLTTLLPLGQLQSGARSGETYKQALTPGLITNVFGALVPGATLTEGGYVQLSGDPNWWIPSGRIYYSPGDTDTPAQELANAQKHFFRERRFIDPYGGISRATYDAYDLLAAVSIDTVNNTTSATNDYLALKPSLVTDPNENRSQFAFDALGFVVGSAKMGKTTESLGDSLTGFNADLTEAQILAHLADPLSDAASLLGNATSRYVCDYFGYYRTRSNPQPLPVVACTLERETHVSDLGTGQKTLFRHTLVYGDGFAREIQNKKQAAPGPVSTGGTTVTPRWIGSGWVINNNKGKPVRKYEPFFTATQTFEFAKTVGVSSVLFYDPRGRTVATLHPDNSWEKTVFDAWRQETWDGNDTALISDPRTDPDAGPFFVRLLGAGSFTSWHDLRIGGTYGSDPADCAAQQDAAKKTEAHAGTPAVIHFDALARECLRIADNGGGNRFPMRTARDVDGHELAIIDAQGRRAAENCVRGVSPPYTSGYDLTGSIVYRNGMDAGARQVMADIGGKPLRRWDVRGNAFRYLYDLLRRPTHVYVSTGGAPEILTERSIYGEGQASANLCTRLFRQYDCEGLASNEQYDYTGNLTQSARQFAVEYWTTVDWSPIASISATAALDAATAGILIPADRFVTNTLYDALNRPIQTVTPHSSVMHPNVVQPLYNEAGLPDQVDVWTQQPASPTGLLDPSTADLHAVTGIDYNARGQRTEVDLGNQCVTTYAYDPQTFRMVNLTTTRPNTFAANQRVVQDLAYAYDPVGNVTRIVDSADTQNVIFFKNQRVDPTNDYTYDPLYWLIRATGREHLGQTGGALSAPQQITNDDSFRTALLPPGDGNAMGAYTETYAYDSVGNILSLLHQVSSGAWTRQYAYSDASQIVATDMSNRLSATSLPGDPAGGPYSALYSYDPHGNMRGMPHLPSMVWDEYDRLRSTARQVVKAGVPETTYYNYATSGERGRKTTDGQAETVSSALARSQRLYLPGLEIYREFGADGVTVMLQRETLHVSVDPHRVVLVETRTIGTDRGAAKLIRYQYGNHLDSATLELDDAAQIITYEEYFPFGSTSYQAVRSQTDTPKRYRYTAKERDEENDLYYNNARYHAPWLGRWTSCDPAGMVDGTVPYVYVRNNPVRLMDPRGMQSKPAEDQAKSSQTQDDALKHPGTDDYSSSGGAPLSPDPATTKLGSDPQAQLLGPTQNAFVPRAIRPYATLEFVGSGSIQSSTDPTQGATAQGGFAAQGRFTTNPNTELGVGGSYGRVFTLNGVPLLSPAKVGSLFASVHFSEAQPANADTKNTKGAGFFAQGGAAFGAGPKGEAGAFGSATGAYSYSWPNNSFLTGVDVNAGIAGSKYLSINGITGGGVVQPFGSVNLALPAHINFEVYGSVPVATGGNLTNPLSTTTPASVRLGAGLGWQIPLGDYTLGAEVGVTGEVADVHTPGGPVGNVMPWLNIDITAVNRSATTIGDVGSFPKHY